MKPSSKPCPGCSAKGAYRKADEVCNECKALIKEAKARRNQVARLRDTEPTKLPFAPHCLPLIHRFRDFGRGPDVVITHFIFDLIHLVGQEINWTAAKFPPETRQHHHYLIEGPSGCDSGDSTYWLIPRGLKQMLNSLYSAIQGGSEFAYQEGKQAGHNLIMGLATGETSIDELNEATVGTKLIRKGRRAARTHRAIQN